MAAAQLGRWPEKCIHAHVIDQRMYEVRVAVDSRLPWHIYTLEAEPRDPDIKSVKPKCNCHVP
jgi:hypothetical protein